MKHFNKLLTLAVLFFGHFCFSMQQSNDTKESLEMHDRSTPQLAEICCKKIAEEFINNLKSGNTLWLNNLKTLHSNLQYDVLRAIAKYYPDFIWRYIKDLKKFEKFDKQTDSGISMLTNLCRKSIVDKLVDTIKTEVNLNELFNILQLPKELQSIILKAFFKYYPDIAWQLLPEPISIKNFVKQGPKAMTTKSATAWCALLTKDLRLSCLNISSNGRFLSSSPDKGSIL